MKLSPNFALAEFTTSQTAARFRLDNNPPASVIEHLKVTAAGLEKVRELLGRPILISSGYRSREVNTKVGGSATSAHVFGYAADFISPGYGDPLAISRAIVASRMPFDQLIEEGTWVHISFDPRMRGEVLTKGKAGGYLKGIRS